ncbi:hypothetical protein GCM10027402_35700 [Arthrobacter monumenti]
MPGTNLFVQPGPASARGSLAAVVPYAHQGLGHPYVWGGTSFASGWDCSGFVQWAFAQAGFQMPRVSQWEGMQPTQNPSPGDLVTQRPDGPNHWAHVGIYIGDGMMISALNPDQGTIIHSIGPAGTSWFFTLPGTARSGPDPSDAPGSGLTSGITATVPGLSFPSGPDSTATVPGLSFPSVSASNGGSSGGSSVNASNQRNDGPAKSGKSKSHDQAGNKSGSGKNTDRNSNQGGSGRADRSTTPVKDAAERLANAGKSNPGNPGKSKPSHDKTPGNKPGSGTNTNHNSNPGGAGTTPPATKPGGTGTTPPATKPGGSGSSKPGTGTTSPKPTPGPGTTNPKPTPTPDTNTGTVTPPATNKPDPKPVVTVPPVQTTPPATTPPAAPKPEAPAPVTEQPTTPPPPPPTTPAAPAVLTPGEIQALLVKGAAALAAGAPGSLGTPVTEPRAGDLVYYASDGTNPARVGVFLGDGTVLLNGAGGPSPVEASAAYYRG